ncbi:DUF397 domain-containing protein [Streptomyces sp. NBC_01476]|uniref:DUF397 domain-containing protein n=1 Tax=Streptomyces sp. NBC_01476 TaxID=2903881 RepID=UPI002E2EB36C|nr:DUF397 domain-containing protein [Streptomyces sp. NBC_01476]
MASQQDPTDNNWKKSSYSAANGDCVEMATAGSSVVAVRDSKDPAGPVLRFSATSWSSFIKSAHLGEFPEV